MKTTNASKIKKRDIFLNFQLIGLFLLSCIIFAACEDHRVQIIKSIEYQPVYMSQEEFINAVDMEEPRELENPGKIYFYDDYLFVNEVNEGIHIFDNSDPAAPADVGFINIPANKDMAVKGNLLYADSHADLLVFDIDDIQDAQLIARKEDVFLKSANEPPAAPYSGVDPDKGIVVDWEAVEVERVCEYDCTSTSISGGELFSVLDSGTGSSTGVGGSMARFVITGDHLYAVDEKNLLTFNITSSEPNQESKQDVGWAIETIFSYNSSLYIGSQQAMYIYDISSPAAPTQLSVYSHFTACDPVVVEDSLAYVTLRSGGQCPRAQNRLEVVDVKNPTMPHKIAAYPMANPHGLGIDNGYLFVSEGDMGLKIMDAENPLDIKLLRHIEDIKTFDVIPFNDVLMVTGKSGIQQYDYSDINDIQHLSTIPVKQ